jgi:hypothetical protein
MLYRATGKVEMPEQAVHAGQQMTVQRSRDEAYRFCRDLGNWPKFVQGMCQIQETAPGRFQCLMGLPGGMEECS